MSIFTRRHYVFLASTCRDMIYIEATDRERNSESDFCIKILADALANESPGFKRDLFLRNVYGDPTAHEDDEGNGPTAEQIHRNDAI